VPAERLHGSAGTISGAVRSMPVFFALVERRQE